MLNAAERERSCLYARKKWVVDALRRRVRRGTLLEVAPNCFVRWSTWQKLKNTRVYELGDSFGPVHRHLQRATMALPSKAA